MSSVNKSIKLGRIGSKKLSYTEEGVPCFSFSVATDHIKEDGQKATDWHRCILWDTPGEDADMYVEVGMLVYLEGRDTTRKWTDKEGVERYSHEILIKRLDYMGKDDTWKQIINR